MDLFNREPGGLVKLSEVSVSEAMSIRVSSCIPELDVALGGGFVRGGVVLFGGEPGVGKSTLLLQILDKMSQSGRRCVYDSAEESIEQLKMTSQRALVTSDFAIGNIPEVTELGQLVQEYQAEILVIDSIQGFTTKTCDKRAGSPTQLTVSCNSCIRMAKTLKIPLVIICQLTTQGTFKGPKDLEHNVDTCGMLRHGKETTTRSLIFEKNRYGPTQLDHQLRWLPDVGRYDLDQAIPQERVMSAVEKKPKTTQNTTTKKKRGKDITNEDMVIAAAHRFQSGFHRTANSLLQHLSMVALIHCRSFTISATDGPIFGVSVTKFTKMLEWAGRQREASICSREPITIVV